MFGLRGKPRLGIGLIFVAAAVFSLLLLSNSHSQAPQAAKPINVITLENAQAGSSEWRSPDLTAAIQARRNRDALVQATQAAAADADSGAGVPFSRSADALNTWSDTKQIYAYASHVSVNKGESISFHVSSKAPTFKLQLYRIGWYNGDGARLMRTVNDLIGTEYPIPAPDPSTGVLELDWPAAYTFSVPSSWVSGIYQAKFTTSDNQVTYAIFILRDDSQAADILFQVVTSTYQAYNNWGGKSLYNFNSTENKRAHKVSYLRPYSIDLGNGYLYGGDFDLIQFLEREGYNVTYAASEDVHARPDLLNNRKMFLSNYHDEYWSWEMRANLEAWIAQGKHAAILSSNNIYWQTRYEPSSSGQPNTTLVCYKQANLDPMSTSGTPERTTVLWRDPPVNRPENQLLGVMYHDNFDWNIFFDYVVQNSDHWLYKGTGLTNGSLIPNLINDEYDSVWENGLTPANLIVLSDSSIPLTGGVSHASIYTAPSGALIFDASTNAWARFLDTNWDDDIDADPIVQQITRNLLNRMIMTPQPKPIDTIGVFRPSTSTFHLRNANTTGPADIDVVFGDPSDLPIVGDWNGDGVDSIGIYRQSTGVFYLKDVNDFSAPVLYSFVLGNPGDTPMAGDWDGDGSDGVGVFRPTNGLIYLKNNLTTGFADRTMVLGIPNDVGIAGDWDGDGVDSVGVYRPSEQVFYLTDRVCNCIVVSDYSLLLGNAGDVPFAGDWDGNGRDSVGVFRPSNGITYFKNALSSGFADIGIVYGIANDKPVAGAWVLPAPDGNAPEVAPTFVPRQ